MVGGAVTLYVHLFILCVCPLFVFMLSRTFPCWVWLICCFDSITRYDPHDTPVFVMDTGDATCRYATKWWFHHSLAWLFNRWKRICRFCSSARCYFYISSLVLHIYLWNVLIHMHRNLTPIYCYCQWPIPDWWIVCWYLALSFSHL